MQETEAKFYVSDLDGIRMRLQSLEAHLIQDRVLETNIRFDLPDNGPVPERRVLRLRQDTEARLTYKSASVEVEGALSRTEIEFIVEDFEKARQFLEALGYRKLFYYEKYRTTYELPQASRTSREVECLHVMLDELPYGNFVEIEGETIESIRAVTERLRLKWAQAVPASYHALFERLQHKMKFPFQDLSFRHFAGIAVNTSDLQIQPADR